MLNEPAVAGDLEIHRGDEPADADELQGLHDRFPDDRTRIYGVTTAGNNPSNEGPELVEPVASDQAGLAEFEKLATELN